MILQVNNNVILKIFISDPFGHHWSLMTHIEDVIFEEMKKYSDVMFAGF
jgi:hypothetical protein